MVLPWGRAALRRGLTSRAFLAVLFLSAPAFADERCPLKEYSVWRKARFRARCCNGKEGAEEKCVDPAGFVSPVSKTFTPMSSGPCNDGETYVPPKYQCCTADKCVNLFDRYPPACADAVNKSACATRVISECRGKPSAGELKTCVATGSASWKADEKKSPGAVPKPKPKPKAKDDDAPDVAPVEKPAEDAFPKALETLYPGDANKVERAIVEHLAKDKAAKDELVAAAGGAKAEETKAKWRQAAVKKAGEHLADPSKDAAFASHLASRSVSEGDLAGYYCPNRPKASGDGPALAALKVADAGGAAAVADPNAEGAKGASALSPAEILDAKCGVAKAPSPEAKFELKATDTLTMSSAPAYGSTLKVGEVPPAGGLAGDAGQPPASNKLVNGALGAIAGAAVGLALLPLLGPFAILVGALFGGLLGALLG